MSLISGNNKFTAVGRTAKIVVDAGRTQVPFIGRSLVGGPYGYGWS